MNKKKLKLIFRFFIWHSLLLYPMYGLSQASIPPARYMDQTIKRKSQTISNKCLKLRKQSTKGFMMIEVKVLQNGNTKARLLAKEWENDPQFLQCVLSILNRIQFKKIAKTPLTRIYRWFII